MTIDYERYVQAALQGAVRQILSDVARDGLQEPNHFYVTFRTDYPGVDLPSFVFEENPEDVTIVLQHQFWDLAVTSQAFSVKLYFQDTLYTIRVPFYALVSFMDPGSRFGLQFTPCPLEELKENDHLSEKNPSVAWDTASEPREGKVLSLDAFRRK